LVYLLYLSFAPLVESRQAARATSLQLLPHPGDGDGDGYGDAVC
jgi:hypothetical protein